MSTAIVRAEIDRFLRSRTPEVLCISGRWGVGKTYAWQHFVRETEGSGGIAVRRYAYVSLFGLNSLAELRNSIVEDTIVLRGEPASPSAASLHDVLRRGEKFARQSRPAMEIAASFFRMKDAGDALYRAAFLTVRDQIICFDDLERAGKMLEFRDVLGLASMLREQRNCKIVLLMNKEKIEEQQANEMDRQLEKVIDTFLLFEPTSSEGVSIAIEGKDTVAKMLCERIESLDITNMRVMKKIERWVRQIEKMLSGSDANTLNQAVTTAVLAGWSFLQPTDAPSTDFLLSYNSVVGMFGRKEIRENELEWQKTLQRYGYVATDGLDREIITGIMVGYFRESELRKNAEELEAKRKIQSRENSFSKAWDLYHERLTVEDDEVLDAMHLGALDNLTNISLMNMNSAVRFLRRYGRNEQASDLVTKYIEANCDNPKFFSRQNRHFSDDPVDEEFLTAIEAERAKAIDARDPAEMLRNIAASNGFSPQDDCALLAKLSADELVGLFDQNEGKDIKAMVEWANRLANQPTAGALKENMALALDIIAARSPMRAERLRNWGVLPPAPKATGK